MTEKKTTKRKKLKGVVIGTKMQKTVKVEVARKARHPVYKKVVNKRKVYFARTEKKLNEGDEVTIMESRPYSKKVRWIVTE